jgi:hypothetical protein
VLIEDWRINCNEHRPHSALQIMTLAAVGASLREPSLASIATAAGEEVKQRWPLPLAGSDPQPAASQPGNDRVLLRTSPEPHHTPTATAATVAHPTHPAPTQGGPMNGAGQGM